MPKVSDLRACDQCSKPNGMMFYRVRFELAIVNRQAVQEYMGMHTFFGGKAGPALINNFVSNDRAVTFAGDEHPSLLHEAWICQECFLKGADLPMLMEKLKKEDDGDDGQPAST